MKRLSFVILAITLIWLSGSSQQQASSLSHGGEVDSLALHLDGILGDSALATCFVGIKIIALPEGRTLYERNSEKMFHPASNMKLFTTAALIGRLDSTYQLR